MFLTDAEKAFWREKEAQLHTPFTWFYCEGYVTWMESALTIGFLVLLFASVCLSGIFTEEHTRRTDQLILSSAKGKGTVYWAKISAGITLTAGCAVWLSLLAMTLSLTIYGADGFNAPLQILFFQYSWPLSVGQTCLILYGCLIITSVFMAVFVMVLSETLSNSIATLSVCTGLIIAGMLINIPSQFRVTSQIWEWLPTTFQGSWSVLDLRTVPIFGHCFVGWKFLPVLYLLSGALLALAGKKQYQRYQVTGR